MKKDYVDAIFTQQPWRNDTIYAPTWAKTFPGKSPSVMLNYNEYKNRIFDFKEAKFIRPVHSKRPKYQIHIEIFKKQFGVIINDEKILVDDISLGLQYIFANSTEQVRSGFFEKIFTVEKK